MRSVGFNLRAFWNTCFKRKCVKSILSKEKKILACEIIGDFILLKMDQLAKNLDTDTYEKICGEFCLLISGIFAKESMFNNRYKKVCAVPLMDVMFS